MLGLIDGNNFYCSCERAFDPALRKKALVVLSNNDGCVISRSNEAKDLGLEMGEPWHLARERLNLRDVEWRSSNYALYGDMSRRMYQLLCTFVPAVEPYSIDEMFLDLRGLRNRFKLAVRIRDAVLRTTKIPTCIGIGPSKTIAKLANAVAKMDRAGCGVCDFSNGKDRAQAYESLPLRKVWGLGPASVRKLEGIGVATVAGFVALPDDQVRKLLTVVGLRTKWELSGIACPLPGSLNRQRKSLAVTRSFGAPVRCWSEMEQAISTYATRAAEKLRKHELVAAAMQVFMHTNKFKASDPFYVNQATVQLAPTSDTFELAACATRAARRIWRDGFAYSKAGIVLLDLCPMQCRPSQLLPVRDENRSAALMEALDNVNMRYGRSMLRPAKLASTPSWGMRREKLSPRFTTKAEEMLCARA